MRAKAEMRTVKKTGEELPEAYAEFPGDASTRVARLLSMKGELDEYWARRAAKEGDLFHPEHWGSWRGRSEEVMRRGLDLLTDSERRRLERAKNSRGVGWAVFFSHSVGELKLFKEAGLSSSKPACSDPRFLGEDVEAAAACCLEGAVGSLESIMEAGLPPPGAFEPRQVNNQIISTPLLALVWARSNPQLAEPERLRRMVSWLISAGEEVGLGARAESGDDALKLAIRSGNVKMAELLLDLGAETSAKNKAGQSAWDVFEQSRSGSSPKWLRNRLSPLEGRLRSGMEREQIEAAAREPSEGRKAGIRM